MKQKWIFPEVSRPGMMYLRMIVLLLIIVLVGITFIIIGQEAQGRMLNQVMASSEQLQATVEDIQEDMESDQLIGSFTATAYCAGFGDGCPVCGTNGVTYSGTDCSPVGAEWVTIAVDERVIPMGTKLKIVYPDDSVIYGIAEDTGAFASRSVNPVWQIDVCYANHDEAVEVGVKEVEVYEVVE